MKNAHNAAFAKVVPTPNNGSTELVRLHRSKAVDSDKISVYFVFQKAKYELNDELNQFEHVTFPTDHSINHYQEWKGYQEDSEITAVERKYGKNALEMVINACTQAVTRR